MTDCPLGHDGSTHAQPVDENTKQVATSVGLGGLSYLKVAQLYTLFGHGGAGL